MPITFNPFTGNFDFTGTSTSSGNGSVLNVISVPTTIAVDTSYIVVDYLDIQSVFDVIGNIGIF